MLLYPASQQSSLLGIKNVQVGSSTCAEHGIKAGTDLTFSIKSARLLSLKELPKSSEGHHPPSLPARFSLWQKRLWTKPQILMSTFTVSVSLMCEVLQPELQGKTGHGAHFCNSKIRNRIFCKLYIPYVSNHSKETKNPQNPKNPKPKKHCVI